GQAVRIFFSDQHDRDEAKTALASRFEVTAVDVSDEDWARRSQENLKPITVGRIIVAPPWAIGHSPSALSPEPSALSPQPSDRSPGDRDPAVDGLRDRPSCDHPVMSRGASDD